MEHDQTAPRALRTTNGTQHAEWVLLVSDLQRCLELVDLWRNLRSGENLTAADTRVCESLFRDAVVSFVSCFDKDSGHVHLDEQVLYGSIDGALAAFQWFNIVRNHSIAHRHGPHRMAHTMAILNEDNGELLGSGVGVYAMYEPSTGGFDALGNLIQVAITYANGQVEELVVKCKAELEAMYPSERLRLEIASYRVPNERSLRMGRRKYSNVNRQIRSDMNLSTLYAPKETRATIVKLNVSMQDGGHLLAGVEVLGVLEEDGTWCAIALEFDLQGYGLDMDGACEDLTKAMEEQLGFAINDPRGDLDQVFFETEKPYFDMFNQFRRTVTLVQLREFATELKQAADKGRTPAGGRPALRLLAIEESSATTEVANQPQW